MYKLKLVSGNHYIGKRKYSQGEEVLTNLPLHKTFTNNFDLISEDAEFEDDDLSDVFFEEDEGDHAETTFLDSSSGDDSNIPNDIDDSGDEVDSEDDKDSEKISFPLEIVNTGKRGKWNVVDADGNILNEKPVRKAIAEDILKGYEEGNE